MKILLVEDNGYTRETIKKGLLSDGIASRQEIFEAFNGLEGVKLYKQELPDVVLMDINMPELNGYEACMQILDINPNACVIFVSSDKSPDAPDQALRVGGIKFFSKPVQTNKINSFIQSLEIKPQKVELQETLEDDEETFFLEEPTETFELDSKEIPHKPEADINEDDFGQPIITTEDHDFFDLEDPCEDIEIDEPNSINEPIEDDFFDLEEQPPYENKSSEAEHIDFLEDDFFAGLEPMGTKQIDSSILTTETEVESESTEQNQLQSEIIVEEFTEESMNQEPISLESPIEDDFFGEGFEFETSNKDNDITTHSSNDIKQTISKENSPQTEDDFFFEEDTSVENVELSNSAIDEGSFEFEDEEELIPSEDIVDPTAQTSVSDEAEEDFSFDEEIEDDNEFSFTQESNTSQNSAVSESPLTNIIESEDDEDSDDDEFDLGDEGFDTDEGFDLGEDGFTAEDDEDDLSTNDSSVEKHTAFHNPAQRKQTIIKRVPLSESKKEELSKSEHHVVYERDLENAKPVNIKPPRTNLLASDSQPPLEEPIMNPSNDIIIDNTSKNTPKAGLLSKVKSIFSGKKE